MFGYELLPFTELDETTRSEISRYTKQMIFKKGETPFIHGELIGMERHLKALKKDGTIDTKHKNVQILDAGKLLDKIKLF